MISFTAIIAESIAVLIINPDQIHIEAIQAWNAGCVILITAAFLEFVIVHNLHRKREAERTDVANCKVIIAVLIRVILRSLIILKSRFLATQNDKTLTTKCL